MLRYLTKSILLLSVAVILCSIIYPLALWGVGQIFFSFQANGSLIRDSDGKIVGSKLIAQPFTQNAYFHSRPSAASYNASASASSALAASNYALRDRVSRSLGMIARYQNGPQAGHLVAPDIESWFAQDIFQGKPHIVAQWATMHPLVAQAWVGADKAHTFLVDHWAQSHLGIPHPQAADLVVVFFQNFSQENPGKFPVVVNHVVMAVGKGSDIQSIFFDMWRQDHADISLVNVPGDMVTTSASGLDPHISLQNAEYQLPRVAATWGAKLKRDPTQIREEIQRLLQEKSRAPWGGLIGEKLVNVLEINLELKKRYGLQESRRR